MPYFSDVSMMNAHQSSFMDIGGSQNNFRGPVHIEMPPALNSSESHSPEISPDVHQEPEGAWDTYARILFSRRIGYPLWVPEPQTNPREYAVEGVSIGDVGIIRPGGYFDFLFNICLPNDHPVNCSTPPNFQLLEFNPAQETIETPHAHEPGCILGSSSIMRELVPDPNNERPRLAQYHFTCSPKEGALLILPNGATRIDSRVLGKFRAHAQRYTQTWYEYANVTLGLGAQNGSLYLVTGAVKASDWCMAAYSKTTRESLLRITPTGISTDGRRYISESSATSIESRTCPTSCSSPNQCVFIRGYTLALNEGLFKMLSRPVKVTDILTSDGIPRKGGSVRGLPKAEFWNWPRRNVIGDGKGSIQYSAEPSGDTDADVVVENHMEAVEPSHPSIVIIRHLLRSNPESKVAIVHDDEWCKIINEDDACAPDSPGLLRRVLQTYVVTQEAGCVFLTFSSDMYIKPGLIPSENSSQNLTACHTESLPLSPMSNAELVVPLPVKEVMDQTVVEVKDLCRQADDLQLQGKLHLHQNDLDEAELVLNRALELHKKAQDIGGEAYDVRLLGELRLHRNELDEARACLERAVELHKQAHDIGGEAYALQLLGGLHLCRNQLDEAEAFLACAIMLHKEVQDSGGEAYDVQLLGEVQLRRNELDGARASLEHAIELHEKAHNIGGKANNLQLLGGLHLRRNRLDEAEAFLTHAIVLHKQVQDIGGEAYDVRLLGELHLRRNHLDDAEASWECAVDLHRQLGDVGGEANDLQQLGSLHLRRNQIDDAQRCLDQAVELHKQARDIRGEAYDLQLLGGLHLSRNQLDEAEGFLTRAIELHKQVQDVGGEAYDIRLLGELHLRRNGLDEARAFSTTKRDTLHTRNKLEKGRIL